MKEFYKDRIIKEQKRGLPSFIFNSVPVGNSFEVPHRKWTFCLSETNCMKVVTYIPISNKVLKSYKKTIYEYMELQRDHKSTEENHKNALKIFHFISFHFH